MRSRWAVVAWLFLAGLSVGVGTPAQAQVLDGFSWLDFKTDAQKVSPVEKALAGEKYTALREIGVVDDAALVITTYRDSATARPDQDRFNVYSVGLRDGSVDLLLTGFRLRALDWERFIRDGAPELVATYDDCTQCAATSFLTSFFVDQKTKKFNARWKREKSGAPLASMATGSSGDDRMYALMVGADGRAVLATWLHSAEPAAAANSADYVFEYDVDPATGEERSRALSGPEAQAMKTRLCKADDKVLDVASGQDLRSCQAPVAAAAVAVPARRSRRHSRHRASHIDMTGQSDPSHPHH